MPDRSYYYYVSRRSTRRGSISIVYALHDNGSGRGICGASGWKKIAEKNGFVWSFRAAALPEMAQPLGLEQPAARPLPQGVYDDASTHMLLPAPGGATAQNFGRVARYRAAARHLMKERPAGARAWGANAEGETA